MNNSAFFTFSDLKNESGAANITERAYNVILGAVLCWGLLLNALLVRLIGPTLVRYLGSDKSSAKVAFLVMLLVYFVLCLVGSVLTRSNSVPKCLIGYHMIVIPVGVLISTVVPTYSTTVILTAFTATAIITFGMMLVSSIFPFAFIGLGRGLATSLLLTLVVELVLGLFFRRLSTVVDYAVVAIMSLYIGYDWVRAQSVPATVPNAIAAASALFLDIINIFLRLLRILAKNKSDD